MIDPETSLAFSVYSNKGVYALLLGSGVSRAAGVPTGWEVVLDLIRKLAHVMGEDPEPEPEVWYRGKFGKEPDYSELLDAITKSSAERSQLLRSYFEPSEDEQAQGLKIPTAAHRAIAELIRAGFVRVVVTTNFDRLLEQALTALGIGPSVVSTPEAAEGCIPLTHSRCTILKVHGDYLDPQLKNTRSELAAYDDSVNRLLDRVFDEYGVIVCGWSGDWDTALRAALERCQSHRFGAFWCVFGEKPSDVAQKLIDHRRATLVKIPSADKFFTELAEKVHALEGFGEAEHPLSTKLAVARLKRHLLAGNMIGLRDLLAAEAERAYDSFFSFESSDGPTNDIGPELERRLNYFDHHGHALLSLLICGAFWGKAEADAHLLGVFRRIAHPRGPSGGQTLWRDLQLYPALLMLYGTCIAAISASNYHLVAKFLTMRLRPREHEETEPVAVSINQLNVLEDRSQKAIPSQKNNKTPLSDHLAAVLREPLRAYIPDQVEYDEAFDWFEYLQGLVYVDMTSSENQLLAAAEARASVQVWGPVGRFAWRQKWTERGIRAETRVIDGQPLSERVELVLRAGLFGAQNPTDCRRFQLVKTAFDAMILKDSSLWR